MSGKISMPGSIFTQSQLSSLSASIVMSSIITSGLLDKISGPRILLRIDKLFSIGLPHTLSTFMKKDIDSPLPNSE